MRVTASSLVVRSGPARTFRQLGSLARDTRVRALESHAGWHWVEQTPSAPAGWVSAEYLAPTEPDSGPPRGLADLRRRFGEAGAPAASAGICRLPESLPLGWGSAEVRRFACHLELADLLTQVFHEIHSSGLWSLLRTFDGCYNDRNKKGSSQKSTHAWGIAVDLNAATNRMGTQGNMDSRLVRIFELAGFFWGGRWSGPARDPMHFQYVHQY